MPSSTKATLLEMMPKRWGSKGMKEQVNISSLWWLICVRDLSAKRDRSIWYRNPDHIHQPLLNNYNSLHCHLLLFLAMVYGISCFNVQKIASHVGPLVASFTPSPLGRSLDNALHFGKACRVHYRGFKMFPLTYTPECQFVSQSWTEHRTRN